jgi:hypothetical protein
LLISDENTLVKCYCSKLSCLCQYYIYLHVGHSVIIKHMFRAALTLTMLSLFATSPASTNFTLRNYDIGTGGGTSSSSSYNLNGTVGAQNGPSETNGITILKPGENPTQDSNVPAAATLSNPNNTYNKLHLLIATSNNPTDTKFAIAISSDGFATTKYIQSDHTLGSTLAIANYQTYALWGGASGFDILGLQANTSYAVKVSALQGAFTASSFGPASPAVATQPTTVSFSVATTASAVPPFGVSFTSLAANTVFSATSKALLTVSSNALFGGGIYIIDSRNGLFSPSKSYTISSATADLTAAANGYGGQVGSLTQTSGGPLTSTSPFNGTSNNVGALNTSLQQIIGTTGPVVGGSAQMTFLAKTAITTPAASDYTDTVTIVASMLF